MNFPLRNNVSARRTEIFHRERLRLVGQLPPDSGADCQHDNAVLQRRFFKARTTWSKKIGRCHYSGPIGEHHRR